MLKFAIIGFGGLGKLHYRNVAEVTETVKDIQLVAICDVEDSAFHAQVSTNLGDSNANLDLSAYRLYNDAAEMLEKEELDFVITALPTFLHSKIAIMAMEKGLHVFSEKPMALNAEQADEMIAAANKNNVKLMIGQCLRYSPTYVALRDLIVSQKYGKVVKAEFYRISSSPLWSWHNWFMDESLSGGAALDMHVHDVDFINWAFGAPKAVTSVATNFKAKHESITTTYHYDDAQVIAVGDWGMPKGYRFNAGFKVRFEQASVVTTPEGVMLYPEDGEMGLLELVGNPNQYVTEVIDFVQCIQENRASTINPPEDSCKSLKIALAEKLSADTGKTVEL